MNQLGVMEIPDENVLRIARVNLDLLYDDLSLETITGKLLKAVQKKDGKIRMYSESALVLIQSLPKTRKSLIDRDKFNIQGT